MKRHAIIPIFIPHRGCKNACVFCNQRAITARDSEIKPEDARKIIEEHLSTLKNRNLEEIEISFFGGSFTGIPIEEQSAFLEVAKEYKDKGLVDKIHLSTRPDYIDRKILDNLKSFSVDVIELGAQSFDEKVLELSKRGHKAQAIYDACELIKEYGFTLGLQLMIGLPGDSYESCIYSAKELASLKPSLARLYPTIVISDTELFDMYKSGEYVPFTDEEMLETVSDMYRIIDKAGIKIMRVGLKSTALINENSDFVASNYHPAFRQLVEGNIARKDIEEAILSTNLDEENAVILITAPEELINNAVGHKAENKKYFKEKYPNLSFKFLVDNNEKSISVRKG